MSKSPKVRVWVELVIEPWKERKGHDEFSFRRFTQADAEALVEEIKESVILDHRGMTLQDCRYLSNVTSTNIPTL